MAQKTTVMLTDDIDGSKADRTVSFGVDGNIYEIDLSKQHLSALERSLRRYIEAGRKVSGSAGGRGSSRRSRPASRDDLGAVRAWARDQKLEVSDRGRIAQVVLDAYDAAH